MAFDHSIETVLSSTEEMAPPVDSKGVQKASEFPEDAPSALPLFYRSYSRRQEDGSRESWAIVTDRCVGGLVKLGGLSPDEEMLIAQEMMAQRAMPSGRWLWVGGTDWSEQLENVFGSYNCSSQQVDSPAVFGYLMDLAMQGCGTGAVLEKHVVEKLPPIYHAVEVEIVGESGEVPPEKRQEGTTVVRTGDGEYHMIVGDSRKGWVDAYYFLIKYAMTPTAEYHPLKFSIDVRGVRPAGEKLKGFGGVANPAKLSALFSRVAAILSKAKGRKLTPIECCLLIDEAALVVVAGNVRRSAGMRQFSSDDQEAAIAKANLWQQDKDGNWRIDPERDALRMANHTRVYHTKPTKEEITEAVTKQFYSGEGAIQYAPEAIARANADLLSTEREKREFLSAYTESKEKAIEFLKRIALKKGKELNEREIDHRLTRYGLNPCLAAETLVWVSYKEETGEELEGLATVEALADDHPPVKVMDANGDWISVEFECTNPAAEIWELAYKWHSERFSQPHNYTVRTTGNHIFFLDASDTPVEVQALRPGDRLKSAVHHRQVAAYEGSYCEVVSVRKTDAVEPVYCCTVPTTHSFDLHHLHSHNCGEILMRDNVCNLAEVHLNRINPQDGRTQINAFKAAALAACSLLKHQFPIDRFQYGRDSDPIVGVSITGLFDFFVNRFGIEWLQWWMDGRPRDARAAKYLEIEKEYLVWWRKIVEDTVSDYCLKHGIPKPNRCTTVQPAGSKSLLTNASPGWHPPKAARFIRRMTFRKDDPIALACMDYGYIVVPSQSDKDDEGRLLSDPFDPRCTEWLVEIPTQANWADIEGVEAIDISKIPVEAQWDFYMQVQKHYTLHNTSATVEYTEAEIPTLATLIHEAIEQDDGYISAALLARFEANETFPRLPFEPINKETYDRLQAEVIARRKTDDFNGALLKYTKGTTEDDASEQGPAHCDSDKCLIG